VEDAGLEFGDVDGDGHEDIIVAGTDSVTVLLQRGAVLEPVLLAAGAFIRGLAVGDLLGDAAVEILLIVQGQNGDSEARLYALDAGGFELAAISVSLPRDTLEIHLADFDRDGELDIATVDYSNDAVWIAPQLPGRRAEFDLGTRIYVSQRPSTVQIADIDADGRLDLLTRGPDGYTGVTLQDQDGSFLEPLRYTEMSARTLAADFDGDGKLDLLSLSLNYDGPALLRVRLQDPNVRGRFFAAKRFQLPEGFSRTFSTGDANGDGTLDVMVTADDVMVILQDPDQPSRLVLRERTPALQGAWLTFVRDLDGDGAGELVITHSLTPAILVRRSRGSAVGLPLDCLPELEVLDLGGTPLGP
jgi:hypothetical protein